MQTNLIGQTCRVVNQKGDEESLLHEVVAVEFSEKDRAFVFLLKEVQTGHVRTMWSGPSWTEQLRFGVGRTRTGVDPSEPKKGPDEPKKALDAGGDR